MTRLPALGLPGATRAVPTTDNNVYLHSPLAGTMSALSEVEARRTSVQFLRDETTAVRGLLDQCRERGIDLPSTHERLMSARALVARKEVDQAFEVVRELKLDLLAMLLLEEPEVPLPEAEVENPPVESLPAEEVVAAMNRAPAWKVRMPRDEAPQSDSETEG